MRVIGVFGGAFDPVHCGHLRMMIELRDALSLDEVRVVPCGTPVHRAAACAPAEARVAMLTDALAGERACTVDRREIARGGPSYTVDTLASMRAEWPDATLCLLVGHDAFAGLPGWHRWHELFDLAHVVVAQRPDGSPRALDARLVAAVAERRRDGPDALRTARAGHVVECATTQLDISSSRLRALAAAGASMRWLVPDAVGARIAAGGWYRNEGE